ncbi:MAG TPA: gluconate 2-dehydrogenase subunit 3 family protein [Longimicrobium sp.]|nr:gluconate 2-dehydrogenase subunit 3 family protein [Longimicrobium sp.]
MSAPLSEAERRTLAAAMDRILPPEGGAAGAAGADAAGYAAWAAGRSFFARERRLLDAGLPLLDAMAVGTWGRPFAECAPAERDAVLERMSKVPHPTARRFWTALVGMTITGFLAPPAYGGNRGGAGWAAIGYQPHPLAAGAAEIEEARRCETS